jgi:hypothetical protein
MALASVMRALDGDVAIADDRFENLPLLAPEKLTKAIAHPSDRITDVRVLRWVEQIGECLPDGSRGRSQAATVCLRRQSQSSVAGGGSRSSVFAGRNRRNHGRRVHGT